MKTKLLNLEYKAKSNVLYAAWTELTSGAQWEEMQEAFWEYVDLIEKYHVGYILVNEQHLKYVWIPETQAWLDANITLRLVQAQVKKIAIVLSEEIFLTIAVEQLMSEENGSKLGLQFFRTVKEAEEWLMK